MGSLDGREQTAKLKHPRTINTKNYNAAARREPVHAIEDKALKDRLPREAKPFRRRFRVPFIFSTEIIQVKYKS